jgi:hypothetical protein
VSVVREQARYCGFADASRPAGRRNNNLIDIDAAPVQQPMQTGWASFNPYAAQQQAQLEEQMRQQQMMELQRQVCFALCMLSLSSV